MASLRDLVSGDDEDDEDYLLRFAKEQAAFLRRKRKQRRGRGQEPFAEDPFTSTDALKWEEEALLALKAAYPSLASALVKVAADANRLRQSVVPLLPTPIDSTSAPLTTSNGGMSLREVCVRLVKMWYPRVWVIPAFVIPEVHFIPLCEDPQIRRTAYEANDVQVEKLADTLVALRGRGEAFSVMNVDYSEERCLVRVLREPIQPYDETTDIADRQRVLAWWPEGDRSAMKNGRVAAVMRAIAIERAKRRQWNQHVAEQLRGSACDSALETAAAAAAAAATLVNSSLPASPMNADDDSTADASPPSPLSRRRSVATTSTSLFPATEEAITPSPTRRRSSVSAEEADEGASDSTLAAGERLYWPAFVKRVVGVFEGLDMFEDSPRGLGALQSFDELGDVIAAALTCPMRLCMDVVFAVDEVSECRRLDLTPDITYAPPQHYAFVQPRSDATLAAIRDVLGVRRRLFPPEAGSPSGGGGGGGGARSRQRLAAAQVDEDAQSLEGDVDVIAEVKAAYADGNGCTVAEANEWVATLRHPQNCPVLTPEVLPEVVSIRNLSFTPAETRAETSPATTVTDGGRPRGTLNAASLSNNPITLYDMLAGPTCQTRSLVLLRASTDMLTHAQREAINDLAERWTRLRLALIDRLTAFEEEPPVPVAEAATPAPPLLEPAQPFVQLPETFETPFIEASAERADDLPPEPPAQENMTEEQLRAATRVPRLQSHAPRTLGNVEPAKALPPSPAKQTHPSSSRSPSKVREGPHVSPPPPPPSGAPESSREGPFPAPPHRGSATQRPVADALSRPVPSGAAHAIEEAAPRQPSAALSTRDNKRDDVKAQKEESGNGDSDVDGDGDGDVPEGSSPRDGPTQPPSSPQDANGEKAVPSPLSAGAVPPTPPPRSQREAGKASPRAPHTVPRGSDDGAVGLSTPSASERPVAPPSLTSTAIPARPDKHSLRTSPTCSSRATPVGDPARSPQTVKRQSSTPSSVPCVALPGPGRSPRPRRDEHMVENAGPADHEVQLPWEGPARPPSPPIPNSSCRRAPRDNTGAAAAPDSTQAAPATATAAAVPPKAGTKKRSAKPADPLSSSPSSASSRLLGHPSPRGFTQNATDSTAVSGPSARASPPPPSLSDLRAAAVPDLSLPSQRHVPRRGSPLIPPAAARRPSSVSPSPSSVSEVEVSTLTSHTAKKKYVLVRRVVRRDPDDADVYVPLPSVGNGVRAEHHVSPERARSTSSPLLRLVPPASVRGAPSAGTKDKKSRRRSPRQKRSARGSMTSRTAFTDDSAVSRDSPSPQRVHSRTPLHVTFSAPSSHLTDHRGARHGSASRTSAPPVWWGSTSPLRSMSFRDSRSQSVVFNTSHEPRSPPAPSISFDVYSLARAATAPTVTLPVPDAPMPIHHPAAVRMADSKKVRTSTSHKDGPPAAHTSRTHRHKHSRSSVSASHTSASQGRQGRQNAFYVHAQQPQQEEAEQGGPLRPQPAAASEFYYNSTAGRRRGTSTSEPFARTGGQSCGGHTTLFAAGDGRTGPR